ncbi:MAG: hypothetical protein IKP21_02915 [Bacteroidales bacterium]|nr:hypothetical protein [Bacteroidales bacterium]MBR6132262.1 hypothetical protein [Bacteroidales bacterium]
MKRIIYLLALMLLASNVSLAQDITFRQVWLNEDIVVGGSMGATIHASFDASGLKHKKCKVCVYLQDDKDDYVKSRSKKYRDKYGDVCYTLKFRPKYEVTSYSDVWIYFPYNTADLKPGNTYSAYMCIRDNKGKILAESSDQYFRYSGQQIQYNRQPAQQPSYQQPSYQQPQNNYQQPNNYNNPYNNSTQPSYVTCPACGGSGRDQGRIQWYTNGGSRYCATCGTTGLAHDHIYGQCGRCSGTGRVQQY